MKRWYVVKLKGANQLEQVASGMHLVSNPDCMKFLHSLKNFPLIDMQMVVEERSYSRITVAANCP